jgi:hypothetical protein
LKQELREPVWRRIYGVEGANVLGDGVVENIAPGARVVVARAEGRCLEEVGVEGDNVEIKSWGPGLLKQALRHAGVAMAGLEGANV